MTKPRIALIGRAGQLAQALRSLWADANAPYEVSVFSRPDFDLKSPQALVDALIHARPNLVINAAAYTAVDKAEDEPDLAMAINGTAPGLIAAAAHQVGAPIIHVSTDYVFDGTQARTYVESDPVAPLGAYGVSKLAGERAVAAANPQHVILRTAWVCSPHGHNFVKTMLKLGAERPSLRVVDDQHGAPTFAADLARAIDTIAARVLLTPTPNHFGLFHLSSAGATTWCGFAREIMRQANARSASPLARIEAITTADYPTKAKRPAYSKLDTTKIQQVYDITLPAWQDGLSVCLDHLLPPPNSKDRPS